MSCEPRPLICSTADTRPAAKSPWPATSARAVAAAGAGASARSLLIVLLQICRHVQRSTRLAHQPLVESLRRVDAAVPEEMVHRDDFRDNRDVLARIERHANLGQLDVENRRGFGVQACAIDRGIVMPLLPLDDDLDALLLAHGANAEDRRDVDETDATNFHVMALQLVAFPDEDVAAAPACDHQIVGDEAVAPLDEIEHAFRFADAAAPDEQQSDAEDVRQRSVKIRRRRELILEPELDPGIELVRLEAAGDDGDARGGRDVDQILTGPLALRDEDAGNGIREKRREMLPAHLTVDRPEIRDLGLPQYLKAPGGKPSDVARKHQPGARDVRILDDAIEPVGALDVLELQRAAHPLHEGADSQARHAHEPFPATMQRRWRSVSSAARSQVNDSPSRLPSPSAGLRRRWPARQS